MGDPMISSGDTRSKHRRRSNLNQPFWYLLAQERKSSPIPHLQNTVRIYGAHHKPPTLNLLSFLALLGLLRFQRLQPLSLFFLNYPSLFCLSASLLISPPANKKANKKKKERRKKEERKKKTFRRK